MRALKDQLEVMSNIIQYHRQIKILNLNAFGTQSADKVDISSALEKNNYERSGLE